MRDLAGFDFGSEETPDHVFVDGERVLGEDGITEFLELFEDFVVDARVVVIRAAQDDHAEPVFALELLEHLAGFAADGHVVVEIEGAIALLNRARVFFRREAEDILELSYI